jgi:hypothetical protein
MEVTKTDLEYSKEYKEIFKDEDIEELIKKEKIEQKEKDLKILKI